MTAGPKSSSAIQMGKLHPQAMVKAYEAAGGRSSFLKLSEVSHMPRDVGRQHRQAQYFPADASCLLLSNPVCPDAKHIFPAISEMHIAWQSSSAW